MATVDTVFIGPQNGLMVGKPELFDLVVVERHMSKQIDVFAVIAEGFLSWNHHVLFSPRGEGSRKTLKSAEHGLA